MRWRFGRESLVREVMVVMLGVLIALGAEQLVTALHWRADVAQTRAAMDAEIADMIYQGYERIAVAPCLSARIVELSDKLRSGGSAWTAAPLNLRITSGVEIVGKVLPAAYRAPSRLWLSDAWKMGIADGTVARLPRDVASLYSQAYYTIDTVRDLQQMEDDRIAYLSVLATDQTLDPASRIEFQRDLATLDQTNAFIALLAMQLRETFKASDPALSDAKRVASYRQTLATQRRFRGACVRTDVDPRKV